IARERRAVSSARSSGRHRTLAVLSGLLWVAGLASVQPKASDHGVASDSLAGPQALVETTGANQTWPRVLGRARVQSLSGSALSLLESLSAWRRAHRDRVEVLSPWYELERPLWRRLRRG
ncbi:unnamed protein product, partial [Polarella glacialis]